MKRVFAWLTVCLLSGCLAGCGGEKRVVTSDTLYVPRIEGMTEAFILGMDASIVPSLEAGGVRYYDFDGKEKDVFEILSENGINYIRVRVWVDPYDGSGRGYGGGNCDIGTALAIGKRATRYGMKLLVDFHYSDFWADPGKQMVPKAWVGMEIDEKADALNRYTTDCLQQLKDAKVDVGMVQLGNETNGSLCGETTWGNICYLIEAAPEPSGQFSRRRWWPFTSRIRRTPTPCASTRKRWTISDWITMYSPPPTTLTGMGRWRISPPCSLRLPKPTARRSW